MLGSLFRSRQAPESAYTVPEDTRVYVVGDIHGRVDLLRRMNDLVAADSEAAGVARKVLVYLGDYVDRGDSSRQVVDLILDQRMPEFEFVHLTGNHEDTMLAFLDDASYGQNWFLNGGDATIYSYGVRDTREGSADERFERMQRELLENLPQNHVDFLKSLQLWHVEGDYLFVHAGIRPGRPPERQDRGDILWIRDEFLGSDADHGKCVVHGHTITQEVDYRPNRIGIDTGAYYTGKLSCLVLEGRDRRLLQT